jgi:hypothetical protein
MVVFIFNNRKMACFVEQKMAFSSSSPLLFLPNQPCTGRDQHDDQCNAGPFYRHQRDDAQSHGGAG